MKLKAAAVFATILGLSAIRPIAAAEVHQTLAPATSPASGHQMYMAYCASCHGKEGKGDGPVAAALKTPPADLATLSARNGGKFPELRVTSAIKGDPALPAHGSAEMPVWGTVFQKMSQGNAGQVQMRIANLVAYVRSIQAK
jgi:mono/diheme cytochrome c family protein